MNVASLFATLGFKLDEAAAAKVTSALDAAEAGLRRLDVIAQAAAMQIDKMNAELAQANAAKALDLISPGNVDEDGGKRTGRWAKAIETANHALGVVTKGYAILSAGVGRVNGLVTATAAQGAAADELSQKLGITAEAVQELGYAANLSGSSQDGLAGAMQKLARNADAAKGGSKEAAAAFKLAGVDAKALASGALPLDESLATIADKFAAMPDGAAKVTLAMQLFGKSGTELIPLLNEGSAGIAQLRQEARDAGYVIGNEAATALEGFGDETDKVKDQLAGVRNQVVTALLPALTELVKGMQAWIASNRADIVAALTAAGKLLILALRVLGVVLRGVVAALAFFANHSKLAIVILAALAAAFLYAGASAAIAWVMALGPIGLIIAAVAAVIALVYVFRAKIWAALKAVGGFFAWVGKLIAKYWYLLLGPITLVILAVMGVMAVFDKLKATAWSVLKAIGGFFADVARAIKSFFVDAVAGTIRSAFARAVNFVIDAVNFVTDKINWLIKQANRLPGVDIGTIGTIDHVGGKSGKAASDPSVAQVPKTVFGMPMGDLRSAGAAAVAVNGTTNNFTINGAADPQATASAASQMLDGYWDRKLRNAAVGTGVA